MVGTSPGRGCAESALGDALALGVPPSDLGDLDLPSSPLSEGRFGERVPSDSTDQSDPQGSVIVSDTSETRSSSFNACTKIANNGFRMKLGRKKR